MDMMKVAVLGAALGVCSAANAETVVSHNGFLFFPADSWGYVGLQVGYGQADYGHKVTDGFNSYAIHSVHEDDLAGRVYLGVQMNPTVGLEAGYTLFSNNLYKGQTSDGSSLSRARLETQAIDLLATASTPEFYKCLAFRVKGGVAYIISDYSHWGNGTDTAYRPAHTSNDRFAPAAGASLVYRANDNIGFDLSYLHMFAPGNIDTPETDLVTLGMSVRFA